MKASAKRIHRGAVKRVKRNTCAGSRGHTGGWVVSHGAWLCTHTHTHTNTHTHKGQQGAAAHLLPHSAAEHCAAACVGMHCTCTRLLRLLRIRCNRRRRCRRHGRFCCRNCRRSRRAVLAAVAGCCTRCCGAAASSNAGGGGKPAAATRRQEQRIGWVQWVDPTGHPTGLAHVWGAPLDDLTAAVAQAVQRLWRGRGGDGDGNRAECAECCTQHCNQQGPGIQCLPGSVDCKWYEVSESMESHKAS